MANETDDEILEKVARAICAAAGADPDDAVPTGKTVTRRDRNAFIQESETRPKWREFEAEARRHIAAWSVLRKD
ncbi:hypothetical protein [Mesorhizobium sp. M0959]|uniref:hypothetical protein n=1 Tax=unclassified Mesorhizobium TaxID=325217 RepID=UPI0033361929